MSLLRSSKMPALVTAAWLSEKLAQNGHKIRILDASWYLPSMNREPAKEYEEKHIPGAEFFDIDSCCDQKSAYEHMLPSAEEFSKYVGRLGVDNSSQVVVYDDHRRLPVFSAPRCWWMFRYFGHEDVSVLEGGLSAWIESGQPTTCEATDSTPAIFTPKPQPDLLKKFEEVCENFTTKEFQLMDARPNGRFNGTEPEPRKEIHPGHMPNSISAPFTTMFDKEAGTFKSVEELQRNFTDLGIDLSKPVTSSCGSGISACVLALSAYLCGKEDVSIYDGAWTEFFLRADPKLILTNNN